MCNLLRHRKDQAKVLNVASTADHVKLSTIQKIDKKLSLVKPRAELQRNDSSECFRLLVVNKPQRNCSYSCVCLNRNNNKVKAVNVKISRNYKKTFFPVGRMELPTTEYATHRSSKNSYEALKPTSRDKKRKKFQTKRKRRK